MLGVQPGQPGHRIRAGQLGRYPLGQGGEISGVPAPGGSGLAVGQQLLAPVLTDGLQHGQPGLAAGRAVGRIRSAQQAGRHHSAQCFQLRGFPPWGTQPAPVQLRAGRADRGRRVQGGPAHEHRQLPEQLLLRPTQQVVAPGDRVAHGLLPGRQVVRALGQLGQRSVQPLQQPGRRQHRQPGRGQLQGQRDPVQPTADSGHGRAGRAVRGELDPGGGRPVQEQLRRGRGRQFARTGRQLQGVDRVLPPGPDPQRDPAGDQHDHGRAGFQQGQQVVPRAQHVLEVVQQEQDPPVPQRGLQQAGQRGRVPLVHAELPGDRVQDVARVAQRRQVDERHAVPEVRGHPPGDLDGQPGLAHAARAGEHQQLGAAPAQQPDHGRGRAGPPDQRRQRPRQHRPREPGNRPGS